MSNWNKELLKKNIYMKVSKKIDDNLKLHTVVRLRGSGSTQGLNIAWMAKEQIGSSIGYQSKTVERVEDDSEDGRNEGGCRIAGILESSIVATQR